MIAFFVSYEKSIIHHRIGIPFGICLRATHRKSRTRTRECFAHHHIAEFRSVLVIYQRQTTKHAAHIVNLREWSARRHLRYCHRDVE